MPEVIEEFLEEPEVAEWMHELAELIKHAVETDILDNPRAKLTKTLAPTDHHSPCV